MKRLFILTTLAALLLTHLMTTGRDLKRFFTYDDGQRMVVIQSVNLGRVVITHGGSDGSTSASEKTILAERPDTVIACHPAAVKSANPSLPILGEWGEETHVLVLPGGWVFAWPLTDK